MAYRSNALFIVLTVAAAPLGSGCALGSMPDGDPAALGSADTEGADTGTPLTTGAGVGSSDDAGDPDMGTSSGAEADDGMPSADDGGDSGELPSDDDGTTGDGTTNDGSTGAVLDDDGGSSGGGDDAGTTGEPVASIDLSGWELVQTASDRTLVFPPGTVLNAGEHLVIGRDASFGDFAAFWGALPETTVYLNGAGVTMDQFPLINGEETYELRDANGNTVDGPTAPMVLGGNRQRLDPVMAAGNGGAWIDSGNPNADANPGGGQVDDPAFSGVYVSEVSDVAGNGAYVYEFVELYFDE